MFGKYHISTTGVRLYNWYHMGITDPEDLRWLVEFYLREHYSRTIILSVLQEARRYMNDKKEGGKLKLWQFHTIFDDVDRANKILAEQGRDLITTDKVYKLSAIVVEDYCGRWNPGDSMHTSIVISFDKETGRLETENTIYYLEGDADPDGADMGPLINSIYY